MSHGSGRTRLFCLPFAGAGASVYRSWRGGAPSLEICPVQLPGREERFREAPQRRLDELAALLVGELGPRLDEPYALFGYSMGALLAFEVAHRAVAAGRLPPVALFAAAAAAPHLQDRREPLHRLPDADLVAALRRMDGTPPEVLGEAELLELLLPVIRADFEVCETWTPAARVPLACPIVAFGGSADPTVPSDRLDAWAEVTSGAFRAVRFAAAHFFLRSHEREILARVQETMTALARGNAAPR
jgi:medium-chain acyl-[acyl-carrier-protein] hydrolase